MRVIQPQLLYAQSAYITKKPGDKMWATVKGALPKDALAKHIEGTRRFGVPFLQGDRCMAAMIDLDDHDGSLGWETMKAVADQFLDALFQKGLLAQPFRSGGGAGINLWLVWAEPQQAAGVRRLLAEIASTLGYRNGAGGVAKKQVEIFPKQDRVEEGEIGNCAALPRSPLDYDTLADVDDEGEWLGSTGVEPIEVDDDEATGSASRQLTPAQIDDLLSHIPNQDLEYDLWIKVLSAIKQAGGTEDQALAWSRTSPKHDDKEFRKKFKSFKRSEGNVVGANSLIYHAKQGGWQELTADIEAFPLQPMQANEDGEVMDIGFRKNPAKGRWYGYYESTLEQIKRCIDLNPHFPWRVAFDEFSQDILFRELGSPQDRFRRLMDADITRMRVWFEENQWMPVSKDMMRDAVHYVAHEHGLNIATAWANSLQWDGVDRYEDALLAMGMEVNDYSRAVMAYWWTSHGARAVEPGYQCDSIIVLISPTQGEGKSSLIRALAPKFGDMETYRDINIEQLLKDDTSARALRGCLVANMDEMRNFSKREAAEAKAALSRTRESYTPKYLETRSEFGRQCVIYATNNHTEFLDDDTGNRRYYTLTVQRINIEWFKTHRDQLWAQGISQFKATGQAWQEAARVAPKHVKKHEVHDVWEDRIADYLETQMAKHIGIEEVLTNAIQMPVSKQARSDELRVAKVLRQLGWERKVVREGNKLAKRWCNPDITVDFPTDEW